MSLFKALLFLFLLPGAPIQAVVLFQSDHFSSNSSQWSGGQGIQPTWVSGGGPSGGGDGYLQISTQDFHLGARNTSQWSGNYSLAGVTGLQMDLNLMGPANADIRLLFFGPGGAWATRSLAALETFQGWVSVSFSLRPEDLIQVPPGSKGESGTGMVTDTLSAVTNILVRNDREVPTHIGNHPPHITTTLGIDNITAIPEPNSVMLMSVTILLLNRRRRTGPSDLVPSSWSQSDTAGAPDSKEARPRSQPRPLS